jgi:hypothetical protein
MELGAWRTENGERSFGHGARSQDVVSGVLVILRNKKQGIKN